MALLGLPSLCTRNLEDITVWTRNVCLTEILLYESTSIATFDPAPGTIKMRGDELELIYSACAPFTIKYHIGKYNVFFFFLVLGTWYFVLRSIFFFFRSLLRARCRCCFFFLVLFFRRVSSSAERWGARKGETCTATNSTSSTRRTDRSRTSSLRFAQRQYRIFWAVSKRTKHKYILLCTSIFCVILFLCKKFFAYEYYYFF